MSKFTGEFFDRNADFDQWERDRPHRHQPAAICFLTMRLYDSIPRSVVLSWHLERINFLQRFGVSVGADWKKGYDQLTKEQQVDFNRHFSRQRETTLDECHGRCEFLEGSIRAAVIQSLEHFHGERYWMGDYVIMPNHVHCSGCFQGQ